jgi:serine/threonine protein kinase
MAEPRDFWAVAQITREDNGEALPFRSGLHTDSLFHAVLRLESARLPGTDTPIDQAASLVHFDFNDRNFPLADRWRQNASALATLAYDAIIHPDEIVDVSVVFPDQAPRTYVCVITNYFSSTLTSYFYGSVASPSTAHQMKILFVHLVDIVRYFHVSGWVHGSICPEHILVQSKGTQVHFPVLSSFMHLKNMATDAGRVDQFELKDRLWLAPEVIQTGVTTYASDIYSLGQAFLPTARKCTGAGDIVAVAEAMAALRPQSRPSMEVVVEIVAKWGIPVTEKYGFALDAIVLMQKGEEWCTASPPSEGG